MNAQELTATHDLHTSLLPRWKMYIAAYEGTDALLEAGALARYEGEDDADYLRRKSRAYGFGLTRTILDLKNHYLFEKPAARSLGDLETDPLWRAFGQDCDLRGTDLDVFLNTQSLYASIFGHVGILVDLPGALSPRRSGRGAEAGGGAAAWRAGVAKVAGVARDAGEGGNSGSSDPSGVKALVNSDAPRPFLAAFHPPAILDWREERDATGRPRLVLLKLLEAGGTVLVWGPETWERWSLEEGGVQPQKLGAGRHGLGEIPFVWLFGTRGREPFVGVSDAADLYRIDVSNLNDLSTLTEAMTYGGFPMLMHPRPPAGRESASRRIQVGPRCILWTDPETPSSRPEWLIPPVGEVVDAVLKVLAKKAEEAYRLSNTGGVAAVEIAREAKSGTALKQEFKVLNAALARKAANLEEVERSLLRLWLKWLGREPEFASMTIIRPRDFSVEDLAADLETALLGQTLVAESPTFLRKLKLAAARRLVVLTREEEREVEGELGSGVKGVDAAAGAASVESGEDQGV